VVLEVYDSNSDLVRTLIPETLITPGFISAQWDGTFVFGSRVVPAGLYVLRLRATAEGTGRTADETILLGVMK
jgi:hypothetical protein